MRTFSISEPGNDVKGIVRFAFYLIVGGSVDLHSRSMERLFYIYLLASQPNGTLYIGVTNDLVRRVWEHKNDVVQGFSKTYQTHTLVWYETTPSSAAAIQREKTLKKYPRSWKVNLIEAQNPHWVDLYESIC